MARRMAMRMVVIPAGVAMIVNQLVHLTR